jgi:hypothetical protein
VGWYALVQSTLGFDAEALAQFTQTFFGGEILPALLNQPSLLHTPSEEASTNSEWDNSLHPLHSLLMWRLVGTGPLLVLFLGNAKLLHQGIALLWGEFTMFFVPARVLFLR